MLTVQNLSTYLPKGVLPTFAQDAVTLASGIGIAEIWMRVRALQTKERTIFDHLSYWSDYPSAVIVAALSYSAFEAHNWASLLAGTILLTPLVEKTVTRILSQFYIKIKRESQNQTIDESQNQNNDVPEVKGNFYKQSALITSYCSYLLTLSCKIALIALSGHFFKKEFASLNEGNTSLTSFVFTALSTGALIEATLQYYQAGSLRLK